MKEGAHRRLVPHDPSAWRSREEAPAHGSPGQAVADGEGVGVRPRLPRAPAADACAATEVAAQPPQPVLAPGPQADGGAARAAYRRTGDAVDEGTVLRYLPLVKHVAARLAMGLPNHIELDELHSYGIFGLLDALRKFDPGRGVKFETYAFTRIRGAILDGLRTMDWVPTSMRQRARQVEMAFARVEARLGRGAEDAEVAEELGVGAEEYARTMTDIERASILSLDELWGGEESGEEYTLRDLVRDEHAPDPTESAEWHDREAILAAAVEGLPERERTVLTLFYYDGLVPKEIAQVLGVSVSRISQLHSRAVLRLKGRLLASQGGVL